MTETQTETETPAEPIRINPRTDGRGPLVIGEVVTPINIHAPGSAPLTAGTGPTTIGTVGRYIAALLLALGALFPGAAQADPRVLVDLFGPPRVAETTPWESVVNLVLGWLGLDDEETPTPRPEPTATEDDIPHPGPILTEWPGYRLSELDALGYTEWAGFGSQYRETPPGTVACGQEGEPPCPEIKGPPARPTCQSGQIPCGPESRFCCWPEEPLEGPGEGSEGQTGGR